jgi:hypothetical protein
VSAAFIPAPVATPLSSHLPRLIGSFSGPSRRLGGADVYSDLVLVLSSGNQANHHASCFNVTFLAQRRSLAGVSEGEYSSRRFVPFY